MINAVELECDYCATSAKCVKLLVSNSDEGGVSYAKQRNRRFKT